MDIYYPSVNLSKSHVDNYFEYTPADTEDIISTRFMSGATFGHNKLRSVGQAVGRQFYNENTLTVDEYNDSQYFRPGLEVPQTGVRESVARSLSEAYDRRYTRDLTLSRAQRTFGVSAAGLTAEIVGSVFDYTNIGIAIAAPLAVGLYAPARAAAIAATSGVTAKFGTTAGRVAAGAGEAALAGVAFEAGIALPGAYLEQDPDYGLMDAFINVTAGAILGGAVTGIGGKMTDVFARAKPETVQAAYETSLGQLATGQPVNVTPVLKTDPALNFEYKRELDIKTNRVLQTVDEAPLEVPGRTKELPPSLQAAKKKPSTNLNQFIIKKGGINPKTVGVANLLERLQSSGFRVLNKKGLTLEQMKDAAQEEGFFPSKVDTFNTEVEFDEFVDAVETDAATKSWYSDFDAEAIAYREATELEERVAELGIDPRGLSDEELFDEITIAENSITEEQLIAIEKSKGPGVTEQELHAEIARVQSMNMEELGLQDFNDFLETVTQEAVDFDKTRVSVDSEIAEFNKQIELLEDEVRFMADNELIDDATLVELDEWSAYVERSEKLDDVFGAGARCVMGSLTVG